MDNIPVNFLRDAQSYALYDDLDKAETKFRVLCREATMSKKSAVAASLKDILFDDAAQDLAMPPFTTAADEMTRMLLLADFSQREVAVRVLAALNLGRYARELQSQATIKHRDDLPLAQLALRTMIDKVRAEGFTDSYSASCHARFDTAGFVLRSLCSSFAELDGYVPKIPDVLARQGRVLTIGLCFIEKDDIWQKVCAV